MKGVYRWVNHTDQWSYLRIAPKFTPPQLGGDGSWGRWEFWHITSLARARTHSVHQGSFSLPGSSTEIGQSHTLKDVLLHHTLLLIPFGRLEQSPPNCPCLCWDWGGAANQVVLVLLQSKRDLRLLFPRAEDKQRGEDVKTVVQDLSSWNCLRGAEKCAEHKHSSPSLWGSTQWACHGVPGREKMRPRIRCQVGMVQRKPRSQEQASRGAWISANQREEC